MMMMMMTHLSQWRSQFSPYDGQSVVSVNLLQVQAADWSTVPELSATIQIPSHDADLYFVVGLRCFSEFPGGSVMCSTVSVWLGCRWPRVVMLVKVEMKTEETKTDVTVTRQHCQKLLHHVLRTRHIIITQAVITAYTHTHTAQHTATQSSLLPTYSISVSLHGQSTHHRSDSVATSASQNTLVITTVLLPVLVNCFVSMTKSSLTACTMCSCCCEWMWLLCVVVTPSPSL